jgi:hypothetical protein
MSVRVQQIYVFVLYLYFYWPTFLRKEKDCRFMRSPCDLCMCVLFQHSNQLTNFYDTWRPNHCGICQFPTVGSRSQASSVIIVFDSGLGHDADCSLPSGAKARNE